MAKVCKDGRLWGQNNKSSLNHLGISCKKKYIRKYSRQGEWNTSKKGTFKKGEVSLEKHPNWKGGVGGQSVRDYRSEKYKEWRMKVFERDNFTCVVCKQVGGNLNSHHIKSRAEFPGLKYDLDNGVTLCKCCHSKTSSYLKQREKE
jgi:hypothetical protein